MMHQGSLIAFAVAFLVGIATIEQRVGSGWLVLLLEK
jgi:hypothetical protein